MIGTTQVQSSVQLLHKLLNGCNMINGHKQTTLDLSYVAMGLMTKPLRTSVINDSVYSLINIPDLTKSHCVGKCLVVMLML